MSNNDWALKFILEFGGPERRGHVWIPKGGYTAVEECLKDAGYLTSEEDASVLPATHYAFTEKAWNLYRALEELGTLSKGAEKPAQSYPVERCIG